MKDQIIVTIVEHMAHNGSEMTITGATEIEAIDIDSLSLYNMLAGVEDEYDVMIPCAEFTTAHTISDLADMFEAKLVMPLAVAA